MNYNCEFTDIEDDEQRMRIVPVVVYASTRESPDFPGVFSKEFNTYLEENNIDHNVRHDPRYVGAILLFIHTRQPIFIGDKDTADTEDLDVTSTLVGYTITSHLSECTGETYENVMPVHDYSIPVIRNILRENPDDDGPVSVTLKKYLDVVDTTTLQKYLKI